MRTLRRKLLFLLFVCGGPLCAQAVLAPGVNFNAQPALAPYLAAAPEIISQSALLIDAETGTILYAKNPGDEIPPASLAKLMTMHLVLKAVDEGRTSLDTIVPIGVESWALRQPRDSSLMFLAPGQTVTLGEIMLGLAVSSGNDAATAAALHLAPTVDDFALSMTMEARRMGLAKTRFTEPSGISENNMTCAAEFTSFCRQYLYLHPQTLAQFHSVPEFSYPKAENVAPAYKDRPNTIRQENRNTLLKTFPGVDGFKTGYIIESGYNIALTAFRDGTRFIAVILGAPVGPGGIRIRDRDGERLLSWAFDNFKTVRFTPGPLEGARIWKGKTNRVDLQIEDTNAAGQVVFTSPLNRAIAAEGAAALTLTTVIDNPLIAPLPGAFPVGWLVASDDSGELYRARLLTARPCPPGNIFKRIVDSVRLFFSKNRPARIQG